MTAEATTTTDMGEGYWRHISEGYYWHVSHDLLCEHLTAPIFARIAYIRAHKPAHEIETRLRLMRPVKGALPAALVQAEHAYQLMGLAISMPEWTWLPQPSEQDYRKAREVYWRALETCLPEIEALHAVECPDCPWDGHTIFPAAKEIER